MLLRSQAITSCSFFDLDPLSICCRDTRSVWLRLCSGVYVLSLAFPRLDMRVQALLLLLLSAEDIVQKMPQSISLFQD